MKLAFALLAHGHPGDVARLARVLAAPGHMVALHYDAKAPAAAFARLRESLADCAAVRFARRVPVHWGEWSVVQGTLNCLDEIEAGGWEPDYVYHLSGMDYPIRPSAHLVSFLERNGGDEFIETVPAETERWVKTGPQRERYAYRWVFNWREQPLRTEICFRLQRLLGAERAFVRGLTPYMGSQWWVLTWKTLRKVMALARAPEIRRFFRTTLVPDELFFQTMVRHVAPADRLVGCPLTLYQFSDYGYPVVYHADHYDYLMRQNFFMARKISPHDTALRDRLDACWRGDVPVVPFPDDDVGLVSPEYEDWRVAYRDGPPGRPVPGRAESGYHGDLKRLTSPCFAVLGPSTAELRAIHAILARQPGLLCHGQIFHPSRIEFADGAAQFAGYGIEDLKLREASAPSFARDVIAAERTRLSGFLLRWGQGREVPAVALERPNVRAVLVQGDPLIAFAENLLGVAPPLARELDLDALLAVPPGVAALRFRRFLNDYHVQATWVAEQHDKHLAGKPKGWMARIDPARGLDACVKALEGCFGFPLTIEATDTARWQEASSRNAAGREIVADLLARGGIGSGAIDLVRAAELDAKLVLALA